MKYNYYFTCVEYEGAEPKTYELLNSSIRFSYIRNMIYGVNNTAPKMCSLILESETLEGDEAINNLFDFFTSIKGGSFKCEQYLAEGNHVKTFVIEKQLLAVNLNINGGVNSMNEDNRGFTLTLKLDFEEV